MTVPDIGALLADIETLVRCESPSNDHEALAQSAVAVATIGRRLLGAEPEYLTTQGCTHLRWRFGDGPSRVLLLGHHDTVWPLGPCAPIRTPCAAGCCAALAAST